MKPTGKLGKDHERVLAGLRRVLEAHPNLRVGQLIINALPDVVPAYYASDHLLATSLEQYPTSS